MVDKVGGTKFIWAMFITTLLFVLTYNKIISGQEFIIAVNAAGGIFVLGNMVNQISFDSVRRATPSI
jgi:hypothetical protein